MLYLKFHQNRKVNEEFDFGGEGGKILWGGPAGGKGTQFKKFEKTSYRTLVPTHTENFSILALLESV